MLVLHKLAVFILRSVILTRPNVQRTTDSLLIFKNKDDEKLLIQWSLTNSDFLLSKKTG